MAAPRLSDAVFERIHHVLSPREIVELVLVIGWYWTVCRLTTTLDIEPEHALGHGVIAMLQVEQDKRSGQPAGAPRPVEGPAGATRHGDYYVY